MRFNKIVALLLITPALSSCMGQGTSLTTAKNIDVCREVFSAAGAYSDFALNNSLGKGSSQALSDAINRLLFVSISVTDKWEQEYFSNLATDLKEYQLDIESGGFGIQASSLIMSNFQTKKYLRLCPLGIPKE